MISLIADNKEIPVEWLEFSDGALTCKVDESILDSEHNVHFNVCPTTPVKQVLEELSLLINALEIMRVYPTSYESTREFVLHLYYLPYARADRVFEKGNPDPLDYFLEKLEQFAFDEIVFTDVHNPKPLEHLFTPYKEISQTSCFQYTCKRYNGYDQKWDYVIAPDKGAKDKAKSIANMLGISVVQASKERDISTGRIVKTELDTILPVGSRVIIVDDIGDYCGTHIALGEILKGMGCVVDLYVTHLIAPKGLSKLRGVFDKVYCYQTVGGYINRTDVMEFNNGKLY